MKNLPLSDYLRMLRIAGGYSQRTVAGWLKMTSASYSHYETCRNNEISNEYLSVLAAHYGLSLSTILRLCKVDIDRLKAADPITPSENLAAFLLYFSDPALIPIYRYLTFEQKWCLYYFRNCRYKRELLSLMSAAPELIPLIYELT